MSPIRPPRAGWLRPLALAALLLAIGPLAWAQPGPPASERPDGRLDVFVFDRLGLPLPGVELIVGPVRTLTAKDGVARLALPAGRHTFELRHRGTLIHQDTVPVAWGVATEVILRQTFNAPPRVDVEAPGWPGSEAPAAEGDLRTGTLVGLVTDARNAKPVASARALVRGELAEGKTDGAGRFSLPLPAGTHTLSIIHTEFSTFTQPKVTIAPGDETAIKVELTPSAIELETIQVSGYQLAGGLAALMQERREERAVTEIIGAEQIAKAGDSDAASALKRVTGLTVVDGKYVFVRGMGLRYSSTLLNGSTLPSPEPERRVVPLDLFPADVIESITVHKSYSPSLPGEFGGGAVLLRTKGIPEEGFVRGGISGSFRDGTTGESGLTYRGSSTDWAGYDKGTRALPVPVRLAGENGEIALQDASNGEGYSLDTLEFLGESMPNIWSTRRQDVPPDFGVNLAFGDRYDIKGMILGFRAAASYENSYQLLQGDRRVYGLGAEGALDRIVDYEFESLENTVDFSSSASVGIQPLRGHEITLGGLWLRRTRDKASVYGGRLEDDDSTIGVTDLKFTEEQLFTSQARGEHAFGDVVDLDWSYTYSHASRYQPDTRRSRYDRDDLTGDFLLSTRPEGNQRLYNDMEDENHDLSGALTFKFEGSKVKGSLMAGGGYVHRERESETRRFKFIHRGPDSRDPTVLNQKAEQIFSPTYIGPNGFSFEETTRGTDSYEAEQDLQAGFAQLDLTFVDDVDLSLGMRVERSEQDVLTFDLHSRGQVPETAQLHETDYLPAINLGWRIGEKFQVRAGYSRTLTRPDFRELSTAQFDQLVGEGVFVGNADLDRTRIDNLDLRFEYYLSSDESISLGVFYKRLLDPIETSILGGSNRVVTLDNADEGRNLGVEIEFRKTFGFVSKALRHLYLAGNFALIRSEVKLDSSGVATEDNRPLQGQSPFVVNASFGYDNPDERLSLALLYNVSGKRIAGIGTNGLPDIYAQPFHQLDAVVSWGFHENWSVKLKAENLLDDQIKLTQDGEVVTRWRRGRVFSMSLTFEF